MGIRGIPIPLIAEPQFSALPYPYAKKGQPSNRLAVLSRFQGCSGGGKLPMVSWETAAAVCGLLRGGAAALAGNGRNAYACAKAEPPFSAWPYPYAKQTLKKDSQAIAWLSSFIPLPGDSCRGWGRHPQAGGFRGGRPTALPRRGRAVLPAQRAPLPHRDRCPPATQGFPGNCPPG